MIDQAHLTREQVDGRACIHCAGAAGPMVPVGVGAAGQVFAHVDCTAVAQWEHEGGANAPMCRQES